MNWLRKLCKGFNRKCWAIQHKWIDRDGAFRETLESELFTKQEAVLKLSYQLCETNLMFVRDWLYAKEILQKLDTLYEGLTLNEYGSYTISVLDALREGSAKIVIADFLIQNRCSVVKMKQKEDDLFYIAPQEIIEAELKQLIETLSEPLTDINDPRNPYKMVLVSQLKH